MTEHGTRSMYVTGCRCRECRLAESEYQRRRRQRVVRQPKPLVAVPVLPAAPAETVGRVEAGVLAEIDGLATAGKRPGLVQAALAMARMLDGELYSAQHPQACARLVAVLAELRIGADSRTGWLAEVRKMTPPASGAAG